MSVTPPKSSDLLSNEWVDFFINHIKTTHSFKVSLTNEWNMSQSISFLMPTSSYLEDCVNKPVKIDLRKLYGIALSTDEVTTIETLIELKSLFSAIHTLKGEIKNDVLLDQSGLECSSGFCARNVVTNKIEPVTFLNEMIANSKHLKRWKKNVTMLNTKYLRGNPQWYSGFKYTRPYPL